MDLIEDVQKSSAPTAARQERMRVLPVEQDVKEHRP